MTWVDDRISRLCLDVEQGVAPEDPNCGYFWAPTVRRDRAEIVSRSRRDRTEIMRRDDAPRSCAGIAPSSQSASAPARSRRTSTWQVQYPTALGNDDAPIILDAPKTSYYPGSEMAMFEMLGMSWEMDKTQASARGRLISISSEDGRTSTRARYCPARRWCPGSMRAWRGCGGRFVPSGIRSWSIRRSRSTRRRDLDRNLGRTYLGAISADP